MLAYPVLSNNERLWTLCGSMILGLILGGGFLAAGISLLAFLPLGVYAQVASFPLLALLFHVSLKCPKAASDDTTWHPAPWKALPICLSVAFAFGVCSHSPSVVHLSTPSLLWILFCVPVGEELLFRGWAWKLYSRLFGNRLFSFTNPLPAAVVATSFSFAFWHLQNLQFFSAPLTLFQVVYTFFVSVWLCAVRRGPGGILSAMLVHTGVNAATMLGQLV